MLVGKGMEIAPSTLHLKAQDAIMGLKVSYKRIQPLEA